MEWATPRKPSFMLSNIVVHTSYHTTSEEGNNKNTFATFAFAKMLRVLENDFDCSEYGMRKGISKIHCTSMRFSTYRFLSKWFLSRFTGFFSFSIPSQPFCLYTKQHHAYTWMYTRHYYSLFDLAKNSLTTVPVVPVLYKAHLSCSLVSQSNMAWLSTNLVDDSGRDDVQAHFQ